MQVRACRANVLEELLFSREHGDYLVPLSIYVSSVGRQINWASSWFLIALIGS